MSERRTKRGRLMLALMVLMVFVLNAVPALALAGKCLVEVHAGPVNLCV